MGLKDNGQTATTADSKARMLNNQFVSVFTDEDIENMPDKGPSPFTTMPDIKISRAGVHKQLSRINPSKASGSDEIPARVLKEIADSISTVMAYLFQQSVDTGQLPEDWRRALVAPVFKKGNRAKPSNYRPNP